MGILDLRTIVLSHLATGLMCALVIGCLWGQYRKRYAGLSFWLADFVLQFAAALLLGLRGQIPDWMSMVLANTLTLTGAFLGYVGLERFVGQISRQWHNYTLLVVFVVVHSYFSMVEPNLTARELNVSAGLFLLCFQCLWLMLWRVNPDLRRITGGVGLVFGAFCLVSLTRIPVLLAHPHTTDDYFKSGLVAGLFLMAYQLILILLSFGLVLLVNGRLRLELQSQEQKFAAAFHSSPYAITLSRLSDGRILEANEGFVNLTGYQRSEVVGKTTFDIHLWSREEDRSSVLNELLQGRLVREREFPLRKKSGESVLCQFSAALLSISGEPWILSSISDLSERKRVEAEREKLEVQNRQLHKSESLGRMAGAIAHHFNNQLQAVMGYLELAIKDLPCASEQPVEFVTEALRSARKAGEVSSLMLTYLGQKHGEREPLDLSDACRRSLSLLHAVMPQNLALETELPSSGALIHANANEIQQVLTNLVTNAWEAYSGAGGAVRLTVKTVSVGEIPATHRFPIDCELHDHAYACLEVADAGCGVPDQDIEKIFDPFFSSKFTGRGLGLSVVLGIVRSYHGVITVASQPGRGSVFRVFFPVSAAAVPQKPVQATQAPKGAGGGPVACPAQSGTVLVVEDEQAVRHTVALSLKRLGFTVLEAKDGIEAVEVFRQHRDEIRCVLCDLTMPRMSGWETLTALRQLAPGIRVILSSGYSQAQVMEGDHPALPQAFLSKPYEFEALADAMARVLANEKAPDNGLQAS
jgi:PAS domain S-box-containing protein